MKLLKVPKVPSGILNEKVRKMRVFEVFDSIVPSGTLALLAVIVDWFRKERWNKYGTSFFTIV